MHDIWNPWHGCVRCSEGCANCYMYTMDRWRRADGANIYRTNNFDYPLRRLRGGEYRWGCRYLRSIFISPNMMERIVTGAAVV